MRYLDSYQKTLDRKASLILILLFILLFICLEYILFLGLLGEHYLSLGYDYIEEANRSGELPLVDKSLLYQKGVRLISKSIKMNPLIPKAYFEYAEAIADIAKYRELRNSTDAKSLGVKEQSQRGYYDLAKEKYTEAILRDPANAIYHQRLGDIFLKLSDSDKAENEFEKAVLLDPQNLSIHLYLSRYFLTTGNNPEFVHHLRITAELFNKDREVPLWRDIRSFFKEIGREDMIK